MKTMRYMTALLAMGSIAAACSVKTTSTDDDGGTGGTGATVASSTVSSTVASSTVASSTVASSTVASSSSGGMEQSPICDSGFALGGGAASKACADCLGASCCTEYTNCFADQDCQDCFIVQQGMGTSCDAGMLDEAVTTCDETNCASECGG